MTNAVKSSEANVSEQRSEPPRRAGMDPEKPIPTRVANVRAPGDCVGMLSAARGPAVPAREEIGCLYNSLSAVTPENHPRTAKLLASGTRKIAQKVIEEAGEVALAAVKHHARGIVHESADLLYQLVALWHRAGIDPDQIWMEMRRRADAFGIAEKRPKPHHSRVASASAQSQAKPEGDQP